VRGVGDDFWSTFVDPEPTKPKKRVMTVWGQGAVNVNTANAQTLLALILAGSKNAKMWTDLAEMQKFLMGLTLLRTFTAGIPLFGSGQDFINAMKGQGKMNIPQMLGITPIQFDAEDRLQKAVTAESKVFSIYADGVVPGYQRKTRVRIHTVVDFRSAPAPAAAPAPTGTGGTAGATPAPAPSSTGTAAGVAMDPIAAAGQPNPGGTIIYYRME
jgi:general secretion pathway protein K